MTEIAWQPERIAAAIDAAAHGQTPTGILETLTFLR
jgi:hypothetical protein